jgi:signal transduction histidine kinase
MLNGVSTLLNGLTNALKVTREGEIRITLTSSEENRKITCIMTDTGPGIDPSFISKQF